jgi:signal transduction histidine kinase
VRVLQGLRDIVWYINPEHDRLGSLVARLRADVEMLLGGRECRVEVAVGDGEARLDMERRRHLLLAGKELLHNVARHAGDCAVVVRFAAAGGRFALEVEDDGEGFDPTQPSAGSGLSSLRRRARRLDAELEIDSRPGGGTRVRLASRGWSLPEPSPSRGRAGDSQRTRPGTSR